MKEVGTLKELDVKPGDVVECVCNTAAYGSVTIGKKYYINNNCMFVDDECDIFPWTKATFRIISRENTPKLWRDMTDAEKGALLLAFHNNKKCLEIWRNGEWVDCGNSTWKNDIAYRVRPEPKVEVVTIHHWEVVTNVINGHHITFNTIDGNPDCASIKMEAI